MIIITIIIRFHLLDEFLKFHLKNHVDTLLFIPHFHCRYLHLCPLTRLFLFSLLAQQQPPLQLSLFRLSFLHDPTHCCYSAKLCAIKINYAALSVVRRFRLAVRGTRPRQMFSTYTLLGVLKHYERSRWRILERIVYLKQTSCNTMKLILLHCGCQLLQLNLDNTCHIVAYINEVFELQTYNY